VRSLVAFLLTLLGCGALHAHIIQEIPVDLELKDGKMTALVEADAAYMMSEYRGDDDQTIPDLAWLRSLSPEEKERLKTEAEAYIRQCLAFLSDEDVMGWQVSFPELDSEHPAYMTEGEPEESPVLKIRIAGEFPPEAKNLSVEWHEPFGVVLIVKTHTGAEIKIQPVLEGRSVVAHREASGEVKAENTTFLNWIKMGYTHILPEGLDHILFVLGLFLLVPKWKTLLQQTITFTVAHSLSLAASVLGWVNLNPQWVEVSIAASIAWVGIENLWAKELGKGRLYLVGAFGLIHGLGFASALKEKLPVETPGALGPALLGFNLGVEGGQITVLLIAFAAFAWWGKKFVWVKWTGSIFVGVCGLLLVVQRAFNLEIIPWL
jgi:hydrogenase/urease accessory protein HupE